jgi:hypothetical protein
MQIASISPSLLSLPALSQPLRALPSPDVSSILDHPLRPPHLPPQHQSLRPLIHALPLVPLSSRPRLVDLARQKRPAVLAGLLRTLEPLRRLFLLLEPADKGRFVEGRRRVGI